jgi:hypothetical protein
MSPVSVVVALSAVLALAVCALAVRCGRRRRIFAALLLGLTGVLLLVAAGCAGLIAFELRSYERLTHETRAAELQFLQEPGGKYVATLKLPSGEIRQFELAGDEWQVDARVLKWHGAANLLGFDTVYRLERLGGRYRDIERERTAPRTVYALIEPGFVDLWDVARLYGHYFPGLDALYGSATYLPLADGAAYDVTVSQSGLIARPQNDAARRAVTGWR